MSFMALKCVECRAALVGVGGGGDPPTMARKTKDLFEDYVNLVQEEKLCKINRFLTPFLLFKTIKASIIVITSFYKLTDSLTVK